MHHCTHPSYARTLCGICEGISLATRTSLWRYDTFIVGYECFLWLLTLIEHLAWLFFTWAIFHWSSKWQLLMLEGVPVDGDDPAHVQWIYDKAKERADSFNIQGVTYRLTQGEHSQRINLPCNNMVKETTPWYRGIYSVPVDGKL